MEQIFAALVKEFKNILSFQFPDCFSQNVLWSFKGSCNCTAAGVHTVSQMKGAHICLCHKSILHKIYSPVKCPFFQDLTAVVNLMLFSFSIIVKKVNTFSILIFACIWHTDRNVMIELNVRGISIILPGRWQVALVNTCCYQSHANPEAVNRAALGLFVHDI